MKDYVSSEHGKAPFYMQLICDYFFLPNLSIVMTIVDASA